MTVRPGNVHARPVRNMNLTLVGFFRGSRGVGILEVYSQPFTVKGWKKEKYKLQRPVSRRIADQRERGYFTDSSLRFSVTAVPRGNGIPVRAGLRVPQKGADALVELRADDVFEFAGLRVRFGFVDGESVFEKALGQAMAADDVARSLAAHGRELHFAILHGHQA